MYGIKYEEIAVTEQIIISKLDLKLNCLAMEEKLIFVFVLDMEKLWRW